MARATKTGSSRRKGDDYQDLTALQIVLESYIERTDFQIFIEYETVSYTHLTLPTIHLV